MKRIKIRVSLTASQHAYLKELSAQNKQSVSSILHRALSEYLESVSPDTRSQEWLSLGVTPAEVLH